jgi:hypothetical protein
MRIITRNKVHGARKKGQGARDKAPLSEYFTNMKNFLDYQNQHKQRKYFL